MTGTWLGIPKLTFPSAVFALNRLFLVSGQDEDGWKRGMAGCWEIEVEKGKAAAAERLITYPPLSRDELESASGQEGDTLFAAAACYLAETNKIFVLGGEGNKFVCEIDVANVSI